MTDFKNRKITVLKNFETFTPNETRFLTIEEALDLHENPDDSLVVGTRNILEAFAEGGYDKKYDRYTKLKSKIPTMAFAAQFPIVDGKVYTSVENVIENGAIPSGLIIHEVDLDKDGNREEELAIVDLAIERLKKADFVYAITRSSSGGIRIWVVLEKPAQTVKEYETQWIYVENAIRNGFGVKVDSKAGGFHRKMNMLANSIVWKATNYKPMANPSEEWIDMYMPSVSDSGEKTVYTHRPTGTAKLLDRVATENLLRNMFDACLRSEKYNPKRNPRYFLYSQNRHDAIAHLAGLANQYGIELNTLIQSLLVSQGVAVAGKEGVTEKQIREHAQGVYLKYQDQWRTREIEISKPTEKHALNYGAVYSDCGVLSYLSDGHDTIFNNISKNASLYIVAATGLGKSTYWLRNYQKYNCDVVIHVPTTALGKKLFAEAKEAGVAASLVVAQSEEVADIDSFDTFLEAKHAGMKHILYIVVQGNLHKIENPGDKMLVVDEAHEFISGTYKSEGMSKIWRQSKQFKKTVYMSGTYITSISMSDIVVLKFNVKREGKCIWRIETDKQQSKVIEKVEYAVSNSRKAMVSFKDKTQMQECHDYLKKLGYKGLIISADNKNLKEQDALVKSGSFASYDYLFCTPLLNIGWSAKENEDIDMIFFGEGTSIELEQFFARVRSPKNVRFYHITGKSSIKPTFQRISKCEDAYENAKSIHELMQLSWKYLKSVGTENLLAADDVLRRKEFADALAVELDLRKIIHSNPSILSVRLDVDSDTGYYIDSLVIDQMMYLRYSHTEMGNYELLRMNLESWGNTYTIMEENADKKDLSSEKEAVKSEKEAKLEEVYAFMMESNVKMMSLDRSDRVKSEAAKRVVTLMRTFNMDISDAKRVARNAGGDIAWSKTLKILKWNYAMKFIVPKLAKSPYTIEFMKSVRASFTLGQAYTHTERVSIVEGLLLEYFHKERVTPKTVELILDLVGEWKSSTARKGVGSVKTYTLTSFESKIHKFTDEDVRECALDSEKGDSTKFYFGSQNIDEIFEI